MPALRAAFRDASRPRCVIISHFKWMRPAPAQVPTLPARLMMDMKRDTNRTPREDGNPIDDPMPHASETELGVEETEL